MKSSRNALLILAVILLPGGLLLLLPIAYKRWAEIRPRLSFRRARTTTP